MNGVNRYQDGQSTYRSAGDGGYMGRGGHHQNGSGYSSSFGGREDGGGYLYGAYGNGSFGVHVPSYDGRGKGRARGGKGGARGKGSGRGGPNRYDNGGYASYGYSANYSVYGGRGDDYRHMAGGYGGPPPAEELVRRLKASRSRHERQRALTDIAASPNRHQLTAHAYTVVIATAGRDNGWRDALRWLDLMRAEGRVLDVFHFRSYFIIIFFSPRLHIRSLWFAFEK